MNKFLNNIHAVNSIARGGYDVDPNSVSFTVNMSNQVGRVIEELKEIQEALEVGDKVGVLDGVVDTLYTALELGHMAKEAGYKLEPAMMKVAENNLSKFPTSILVAQSTVEKMNAENGEGYCRTEERIYKGVPYYPVLRNSDNKFLKPIGYESVEISQYVPE